MVAVGHLYQTVETSFKQYLPSIVDSAFKLGHWGVEIFFVISGFVIAYSVRNGTLTFAYLGRFALRRSIRLDPPYWVIILLEVVLIYTSLYFFPDLGTKLPTTEQLIAHLFYLQGLLGMGQLIPIFWTLCYEVQFYLVLIGSLVLYTSLKRYSGDRNRIASIIFVILGATLYLYSLGTFLQLLPPSPPGLFVDRWYQFFLGALAWWCTSNRLPHWLFFLGWVVALVSLIVPVSVSYRFDSTVVILGVSMLVYIGAITGNLSRWLNSPSLLFLGAISYSLYLVHLSIGWRLIALEKRLLGTDMPLLIACCALISGIFISIVAAWLLNLAVERPALKAAHWVKLPTNAADKTATLKGCVPGEVKV